MKKKLLSLFIAIFLGGAMAYITYKKFMSYENLTTIYAYQTGIYNNYSNALANAEKLNGSIIINDNNQFLVIAAVAPSTTSKEKIEYLLQNENIDYYQKQLSLKTNLKKDLSYYEQALNQTNDLDTLKQLNQKLLEKLQERITK